MPFSIISAESSGGVFSNVIFIASTIVSIDSAIAAFTWCVLIVNCLGNPVLKSRPLTFISFN